MKANSTIAKKKRPEKSKAPAKPYDGFPLFAHQSGQWAKKVKGEFYYFGVWDDPAAALREFKKQEDDLYAGTPTTPAGGLTVEDLANDFLRYKKARVGSGELSSRSWTDYYDVCAVVLDVLGKTTAIETLRPIDFERVRAAFAKAGIRRGEVRQPRSAARLGKDVTVVRMLFKYADDAFDVRVKLGPDFKPPSRKEQRDDRKGKPKKFLEAVQLRAAIDTADPTMKAIILVGLNAALGNEDIAHLSPANIKVEWLDYPRCKTGEERRAWLWPETREAIAAIKPRGKHVFHRPNGETWHSDTRTDDKGRVVIDNVLSKAFNSLIPDRPSGVSFYSLRHVFQTIAEKGGDKEAVKAVMGHATASNDMSARYSEEGVADDRIKTACEAVRSWLYGGAA